MNGKAKSDGCEGPYVYRYFNVRCFTSNPETNDKTVIARLVNCLIKALNEEEKLPHIIVMIPNWDIVQHMGHTSFGIIKMSTRVLHWIITNVDHAVAAKKDRLNKLHPGAVVHNEPKIIWVKMMNRLFQYDKFLTIQRKFNTVLENLLADRKGHYLVDLHPALNDATLFIAPNNLNGDGMAVFWKELDDCIQMFEDKDLTLLPEYEGEKKGSTGSKVCVLKNFAFHHLLP